MQKDLIELRDKEVTLLKNISKQYKNSENYSSTIIYYGLVEDVDRIGNDSRPRYSVLVRLLNIDPVDADFKAFRWYAPFFPVHDIVIPEIGEQVKIILESPNDLSSGYWVSRNDTKNSLTRTLVGENIIDSLSNSYASKYGIEEDITKRKDIDIEPNHEYNIPINRDKPGDVVQSGRSNTEIRHSFDSETKKGYIELSTEKNEIPDSEFYKDDFVNINGSRIILATESDLDKKIVEKNNLQFHENFQGKNLNIPYSIIESDEIRFLSRNGGKINHIILGEAQEEWLTKIINLIETFIEKVDFLNTKVDSINTSIQSLTVGTGVGPSTPPINVSNFSKLTPDFAKLKQELGDLKTKFNNEIKTIPEHRSKKIAVN